MATLDPGRTPLALLSEWFCYTILTSLVSVPIQPRPIIKLCSCIHANTAETNMFLCPCQYSHTSKYVLVFLRYSHISKYILVSVPILPRQYVLVCVPIQPRQYVVSMPIQPRQYVVSMPIQPRPIICSWARANTANTIICSCVRANTAKTIICSCVRANRTKTIICSCVRANTAKTNNNDVLESMPIQPRPVTCSRVHANTVTPANMFSCPWQHNQDNNMFLCPCQYSQDH